MDMATRVFTRYTRLRMMSLMAVTKDDLAEKAAWQSKLAQEVEYFNYEYSGETGPHARCCTPTLGTLKAPHRSF